MAVKTFTTGEVLTAADTNTYLGNAGWVYVNSVAVGSGVTTVALTNAFNTTYDAYKIVYTGGGTMTSSSADSQLALQVGNGGTWLATNYYATVLYVIRASNTVARAAGSENSTTLNWFGGGFTDGAFGEMTLFDPFKTVKTHYVGQAYAQWGDAGQGTTSGFINNSTSYADVRMIVTGTGTVTGGRLYSYGFRTA